jgi:shikimate dehydrogenase
MHNAAFEARGLNAVYLPFEVDRLRDFIRCIEPLGVAGFSVTHPHKQTILRHLHGVDALAESIGAVNTVVVRGRSKLYGYNTDYMGVLRALEGSIRFHGAQVLVVGAGGAARAVAVALATAGAYISVVSRRRSRARELAQLVGGEALPRRALRHQRFDVIVNCTPVGQAPATAARPLENRELNCRLLLDLVYTPLETALLREARRRHIRTVPGWHMLVEQGAAQFELWTGLRAPVREMRAAVLKELQPSSRRRSLGQRRVRR